MSDTTQPRTFRDLYVDLINRVREQSTATATVVIAKRLIQTSHADIYIGNGERFRWTERRATIVTHPEYATGTITATTGSSSITGAGTAWSTNNSQGQANVRKGGKIVIAGSQNVYEVASVSSDTAAVIAPAFVGEAASGLQYRYFEDAYALPVDFKGPVDSRNFDDGCDIRLIGRTDFRRWFPRNSVPAPAIRAATIVDHPFDGGSAPVSKIHFAPPVSAVKIIPYTYVTKHIVVSASGAAQEEFSADTDEPIMPVAYRHVIVLHALKDWYRDRKDDARSNLVAAEYRDLLARMVGDQDIGAQRMEIRMDRASRANRQRRPWRDTGRFDVNGRFDRME